MRVVCPKCGEAISGENIDVARNHAVCKPCGEVVPLPDFSGDELVVAAPSELVHGVPPQGELVHGARLSYRPETLPWKETALDGTQRFSLTPRRWMALPLLGFAGVWNTFLAFWYSIAFLSHGGPGSVMFWFPLLHVAAGLYITYLGLTKLFNKARMSIDRERVRFHVGPLPRRGGRVDEATINVRGFDVWKQEVNTRRGGGSGIGYRVRLLTEDGRALTLPFDDTDAEQAAWIAARLNRALDDARAPRGYRDEY